MGCSHPETCGGTRPWFRPTRACAFPIQGLGFKARKKAASRQEQRPFVIHNRGIETPNGQRVRTLYRSVNLT